MNIYYNDITEPYRYINENEGKNIRVDMIMYLGKKYKINKDDIKQIIDIMNKIHNSSLILDDIEDNSSLRRGKKCAHIVYGVALSVNVTYIILFDMLHEIKCENMKSVIIQTILEISKGQGLDIYISENNKIITNAQYMEMIKSKTSALLSLIPKLINCSKSIGKLNLNAIIDLFEKFGIFYQIRDDLINIYDEDYWKKKGFCSDLYEKKITYVILYAINNKIDNYEEILEFYEKDKIDEKDVCAIYAILKKSTILKAGKLTLDNLKIEILSGASKVNLDDLFQLLFNKF
jgi:geranylgeranyl pyrophosphate synthase